MRSSTRSLLSKVKESAQVLKFRSENTKRSSNHEHETRSGNRPCFRRRSRQSILREGGLPIRYRHREWKLSGYTIYSSSFRGIDHLWQGSHVGQVWLRGPGPGRG